MGMPAPSPILPDRSRRDWTVEQLHALPDDGNRYEVVDGELLVTPAPSWLHQHALFELGLILHPYADACGLDLLVAPAEVSFSPRRSVEPDLFVVPRVDGRRAWRFDEVRALLLAVEIVSPSTHRADRFLKRRLYQGQHVAEYWTVEPEARIVERWTPTHDTPDAPIDVLTWAPRPEVEPLVIDLASYFRRVHGENLTKG